MNISSFYDDISDDERNAAAEDNILGFQSYWKADQKYPLVINKAVVADGNFDDRELVLSVAEQVDGSLIDRNELRLGMGIAVSGTDREVALLDKNSKEAKGRRAALGAMDKFFQVAIPGYKNYNVVKVGKTSIATDLTGNPVKGEDRKCLDQERQVVMMRILKAFNEGSSLDMLTGAAFTYAPKENKKNPDYVFHGFESAEDSDNN